MFRAKTTFEGMARTSVEAYFHSVSDPARADAQASCSARCVRRAGRLRRERVFDATPPAGTDDPLALIQYLDIKTYLVGDINTKVDRASMAHSWRCASR
jgi:asparagine synthase (glutamine-hydrolysing)